MAPNQPPLSMTELAQANTGVATDFANEVFDE
jgi:hypothetical protein